VGSNGYKYGVGTKENPMLEWTRLPRSIRCKYRGLEADVWPMITLEGEKVFKYTILKSNNGVYTDGVYTEHGTATTEEEACRKCSEILEA
jgi:hypothetical protein